MKNRKSLLVIMMLLGIFAMSVPVSAATPDVVSKELQVKEKETEEPVKSEDNEKSEPITPDGNLTLVDDFSGKETEAKQFITLVTKDGNYFYLVIFLEASFTNSCHSFRFLSKFFCCVFIQYNIFIFLLFFLLLFPFFCVFNFIVNDSFKECFFWKMFIFFVVDVKCL